MAHKDRTEGDRQKDGQNPNHSRNRLFNPGVASVFTPSLGTVHECNTSAAVTIIRIGEFMGNTIRLSVSSSRNVFI